ncbi:MAG: rRNA maturation RNase YbeY [Dehalococcoidia bacterium]
MKCHLNIQVGEAFEGRLDRSKLGGVVRRALELEGLEGAVELSLLIADDDTLRHLNREYRSQDKTTDVLSFSFLDGGLKKEPFINPPDGVLHLGQVVISYPQAVRQAGQSRKSVSSVIETLLAHGVLHILGYDHKKRVDAEKMRARGAEILRERI